jgi:gliding motility-associated-like protein
MFSEKHTAIKYYKKRFLIAVMLFPLLSAMAQSNLVPNPSFESYKSCPKYISNIDLATYWYTPTEGTSDYYNSCVISGGNAGVPNNFCGYQYARTGYAYAGFGAIYNNPSYNNREYIAIRLVEPLKAGAKYSVEYYVSLSNSTANSSRIATDALGAFLGDSIVDFTDHTLLNVAPQINNPKGNVINDTLNWIKIGGEFKAVGSERFLTIGNFVDHSQSTNDTIVACSDCMCYYYIDDVSVICLDCPVDSSDTLANDLFIPDAFSPNGDGKNDNLFVRGNNIQELYFAVYDRWGEKVFETTDKNNGWDGTYKGKQLNGAVFVYYCKGKYTDGTAFNLKGDITLIR